uniref:Uncharacterized protein isoform X2 n=1 Tax=Nicotiana tabacum TaxID=4097 RepID=A0A1S4D0A2_TOBAC|nr:PREDICTED: uncharacterized protein LOC107824452 isoform X2 [Nicotiana tabacum]
MNYDTYKREWVEAFTPWKREPKEYPDNSPGFSSDYESFNPKRQRFYLHAQNKHLDVYTKMAALKTSTSVVSLESYSGKEEIFQCSGTIIESVDTSSIILTAASLLRCSKARNSIADDIKVIVHLFDGRAFDGHIEAYDFHYNVAAIRIQSDTPLPIASLAHLNDSIMIRPSQLRVTEEKPFQLRPHSNSFHLIPGDSVIALGRFNKKPYDIMAAPGEFRQPRRPRLGMEVTNLYAVDLEILERIISKFPEVMEGIIVEEVCFLLQFFFLFVENRCSLNGIVSHYFIVVKESRHIIAPG